MTPALPLLLLLVGAAAHARSDLASVKPSDQCSTVVSPVCVHGGLWVMNRCVAAAQKLKVLEDGSCGESPSAFTSQPGKCYAAQQQPAAALQCAVNTPAASGHNGPIWHGYTHVTDAHVTAAA